MSLLALFEKQDGLVGMDGRTNWLVDGVHTTTSQEGGVSCEARSLHCMGQKGL